MSVDLDCPVNGLVIFDVWGELYGQQTRTRFAYQNKSGVALSLLTSLVPAFVGDHLDLILQQLDDDYSVWNIRVEAYAPEPAATPLGFRDAPQSLSGAVTGGAMPPSVAMVLRRRVGTIGRANRGRVYLPGVPRDAVSGGRIAGTYLTGMIALSVALGLDLLGGEPEVALAKPVLVKRNGVGAVVSWQDVGYWDCDPILRSQRRREIGVGI